MTDETTGCSSRIGVWDSGRWRQAWPICLACFVRVAADDALPVPNPTPRWPIPISALFAQAVREAQSPWRARRQAGYPAPHSGARFPQPGGRLGRVRRPVVRSLLYSRRALDFASQAGTGPFEPGPVSLQFSRRTPCVLHRAASVT